MKVKFCKDCEHYLMIYPGDFRPNVAVCSQEKLIDLVDGGRVYHRCEFMRGSKGKCGPDAKLFKSAKKP